MTYRGVAHRSAADFLERARPWLLEREDRNNLILTLAAGRAQKGERDPDAFFGTVERDGEIVGCALRTPPYKVLVTDLPLDAAPTLAGSLAEAYETIPAVLGPAAVADAIATAWIAIRGGRWHPGLPQRLYRLDEVVPARPVAGGLRRASHADTDLVVDWCEGFARDAGQQFRAPPEAVTRWIEREELFIWEDGEPVCMTVAQGRTENGVRVGYVYTPREVRGRGYASACVADVSRRMLESGLSFCVLYTDRSNPTSNAIYQRIGYEPVEDLRDADIVAPDVGP